MTDKVDYGLAIPEKDQEFVILPDNGKLNFASTGPLLKYLDDEIAAWQNVDGGICQQYLQTRELLMMRRNSAYCIWTVD